MDKDELGEELTGTDYWTQPAMVLINHPDFSPSAMRAVTTVMGMTSAQLEGLTFNRGDQ